MPTISLAQIDEARLSSLVRLTGPLDEAQLWSELESTSLPAKRTQELRVVLGWLSGFDAVTANESTLWSRAIFPLLILSEEARVRAWSQVSVHATFDPGHGAVELAGVVDGALAREGVVGGQAVPPLLLVVETKRGIDATDPRPQLLASVLVSVEAERAQSETASRAIERFGCFTVGDTWKFLHAVEEIVEKEPRRAMAVSWSRAFSERLEATAILATLRGIVLRGLRTERDEGAVAT